MASPEAINAALLADMKTAMEQMRDEVVDMRKSQESKGEIYPEKSITITDKVKEINPGVGLWRAVSVHNAGSYDCDVQINSKSDLLAKPVSLPSQASKSFPFTTEVISKLFAVCASGESTTLEVEFKR